MTRDAETVKKFLDLTITRGHLSPIAGPDYVIVWDLLTGDGWDYLTYFFAATAWIQVGEMAPEAHAEVWVRREGTGWEPMVERP